MSKGKDNIRQTLRGILKTRSGKVKLEDLAKQLNPKIRGWVNYYTLFHRYETYDLFYYLNNLIRRWIKDIYKIRNKGNLYNKYRAIQSENVKMFYLWKLGIIR